jgi:sodium transport system permease protein
MIVINLPVAEVPGMRFRLSLLGGLSIFASLVPVLLPVAALQMLVAGRSKTVKEALTGVSICSMLPMIPGLLLIFSPFKSTTSAMAIPMYAQNMITTEVLKAEPLGALDLLVAAAVATLVGALLASLTVAQAARARRLSL